MFFFNGLNNNRGCPEISFLYMATNATTNKHKGNNL